MILEDEQLIKLVNSIHIENPRPFFYKCFDISWIKIEEWLSNGY